MSQKISHSGVVESIQGDCVRVRIVQTSACAACKVASHCNASESKVKMIDVMTARSEVYRQGQEVVVSASREVAGIALLLGFGLPLVLMLVVLLAVLRYTADEGLSALSALAVLIPYYLVLWLLRDRISRQVSFQIED